MDQDEFLERMKNEKSAYQRNHGPPRIGFERVAQRKNLRQDVERDDAQEHSRGKAQYEGRRSRNRSASSPPHSVKTKLASDRSRAVTRQQH